MPHFPKPFFRPKRGLWYVQIDGKQHNLGADEEAAFKEYHRLMAQPKEAPNRVPPKAAVVVIDEFLTWLKKNREPRTYEWYFERLQPFVKHIGVLPLDELKPYHLQDYLDQFDWSGTFKRGVIAAVQRPFRWAFKLGKIERFPLGGIEKPPAGKRENVIAPDEYKKMLSHVRDRQFRDLLEVSWETGCRPQESLRVEARHVDLKNSRWVFPIKESKGKKRIRIVYLNETALAITKRLMLKHPKGKLFRNTDGRPWHPWAVNGRFCTLKKKLGHKYALYDFRHSFAERLLEAGLDALVVSNLLGHADTAMLARVYSHLTSNPSHLLGELKRATG